MSLRPGGVAQGVLAALALSRLARGEDRRPPLAAGPAGPGAPSITVVVPARDEAGRLGPLLQPLRVAPGVIEVLVVDDRSTDATAEVAARFGARVLTGSEPPRGWVGKPWALQQGLIAARGEVVVFLDADVRPDPALPLAVAGLLEDADLASAQLSFRCPDVAQRLLHPALLATLIYRTGPLDSVAPMPAAIAAINGQCFAARRGELISAGGFGLIAGIPTDDVALARALTAAGWRVAVADGSSLGAVDMYESAGEALHEWAGRSLALPGAAPRGRQLLDLGVVWAVQGLPALRLWRALFRVARRRSLRAGVGVLRPGDLALLALRAALQVALLGTYRRRGRTFGLRVGPARPSAPEEMPGGGFGSGASGGGRFGRSGSGAAAGLDRSGSGGAGGFDEAAAGAGRPAPLEVVPAGGLRPPRPAPVPQSVRVDASGAAARRAADARAAAESGEAFDPVERPDLLSLLAPLLDPIAAAALTRGTFAPVREWRGRRI